MRRRNPANTLLLCSAEAMRFLMRPYIIATWSRITPLAVFSSGRTCLVRLSALRNARRCGYALRAAATAEADDELPSELNHPIDIARSPCDAARITLLLITSLISPTHAIRNVHAHIRLLPRRSLPLVSSYFPSSFSFARRKEDVTKRHVDLRDVTIVTPRFTCNAFPSTRCPKIHELQRAPQLT